MNATLRAYPVQQIVDAIEKRAEEKAAEVSPPLGDATPHYVIGRLQGELENALKVIVATKTEAATRYLASLQQRIGSHLPAAPQPLDLRPHKG